jgi:hypothetical protein
LQRFFAISPQPRLLKAELLLHNPLAPSQPPRSSSSTLRGLALGAPRATAAGLVAANPAKMNSCIPSAVQSVIPVFIASPSDVSKERRYAVEAVRNVSARLASVFGVVLTPITWEEFAPISSGESLNPQFNILKRIKSHSIFIGILYKRYGTIIPEMGDISGTESEFNHALNHRKNVQILTYFRDTRNLSGLGNNEVDQLACLNKLKERLHKKNIFSKTYLNEQVFRRSIVLDLFEAALNMLKSPVDARLDHYEKFFHFSSVQEEKDEPLLIIYPPISDPMFGHLNVQTDWKRYLLPTVVLEDTKAIQSLENTMSLIKKNYQTIMDCSPALKMASSGDRMWICIARNEDAQKGLKDLRDRLRFSFGHSRRIKSQINERELIWKGEQGREIRIVSPLAKYLKTSKRPPSELVNSESTKSKWEPSYGFTYARDYAILARFSVIPDEAYEPDKRYFYYYLGGLRALGTWGAAWFIENCSARLARIIDDSESKSSDNSSDIQLLLEVVYRDYKIIDVRNVSDEPESFFTERDSSEYIREQYDNANTHM